MKQLAWNFSLSIPLSLLQLVMFIVVKGKTISVPLDEHQGVIIEIDTRQGNFKIKLQKEDTLEAS